MRRRLIGLAAATALATGGAMASGSTPAANTITAPRAGGTATATWHGTVQPGADVNGCAAIASAPVQDPHSVTFAVPSGLYRVADTKMVLTLNWTPGPAGNDIDIAVLDSSGGTVAQASSSAPSSESLTLVDLAPGTYNMVACAGTNPTPQNYTAKLTVTTTAKAPVVASGSAGLSSLMTFTPATVVDPILFGGEPGLTFDPTTTGSRSFVDWPVSSRTMIGVLFRSEDGGLSYTKRFAPASDLMAAGVACATRQVPYCPAGGGGDTNININPTTGAVQMGEQESLANQAVGISLDHGTTFPADHVDPALDKTSTGVDRQWSATWRGTHTHFMEYHVPIAGIYVDRSDADGATGSWSIPATPQITGVTQSGSMIADNSPRSPNFHALYVGYIGAGLAGFPGGFQVGVSTDGAKTFVSHAIPGASSPRSFTVLSTDTRGNLYAAWVDSGTQKTYLASSLAADPANVHAPATKWSKPVVVSQNPLRVTIFSNILAGSPGRVAIGYYGTTANAATPDAVKPGQGGWSPYVGVSLNALCQWDRTPCATPHFDQVVISHRINHDTNICTSGTTCAADPNANRNLLDYFAISMDHYGHLGFVWSDSNNSTLEPFVKVARQASGPSLLAGQPNASQSQRGNGAVDTAGDARYPIAGSKVLTAPNIPQLDLLGTTITNLNNGKVRITMRYNSRSPNLTGAIPGGGTMIDDSGTPLQQARYVTRWDFGGQAYYVEATATPGSQAPTLSYGAGAVGTAEALYNGFYNTAVAGNTYAPLLAADGTVKPGSIVVEVPAAEVGNPGPGSQLYSVGSYALVGPTDKAVSVQSLPLTVDSTPTFDVTFGHPASAQGSISVSGTVGKTGGAPGAITGTSGQPGATATTGAGHATSLFSRAAYSVGTAIGLLLLVSVGWLIARKRRVLARIKPTKRDDDDW